jgi:hypothetical protein
MAHRVGNSDTGNTNAYATINTYPDLDSAEAIGDGQEREQSDGRFTEKEFHSMGAFTAGRPEKTAMTSMLFSVMPSGLAQAGQVADAGAIIGALQKLATGLVDLLIVVSALLLAIGIANGFVGGMFSSLIGAPGVLSSTWARLAGVVICFLGAALSIAIANSIMSNLNGLGGGITSTQSGLGLVTAFISQALGVVVAIVACLLALSIVIGFVEAQAGYAFAMPTLLGNVGYKIGAVVICLIIAILAVSISNWVAGLLSGIF